MDYGKSTSLLIFIYDLLSRFYIESSNHYMCIMMPRGKDVKIGFKGWPFGKKIWVDYTFLYKVVWSEIGLLGFSQWTRCRRAVSYFEDWVTVSFYLFIDAYYLSYYAIFCGWLCLVLYLKEKTALKGHSRYLRLIFRSSFHYFIFFCHDASCIDSYNSGDSKSIKFSFWMRKSSKMKNWKHTKTAWETGRLFISSLFTLEHHEKLSL